MNRTLVAVILTLTAVTSFAQDKVKHGFNSVPYPVIGYSDDLGIQYGVNYTLFDYGDGSIFPNYRHKAVVELSRYTRGSVPPSPHRLLACRHDNNIERQLVER